MQQINFSEIVNYIFNMPTIISFIVGGITVLLFIIFFFRKEIRLFRNIKRPIMIFKSDSNDMELETKLLKRTGFFKIEEPTNNHQVAIDINNHALIIIGWCPQMATEKFKKIIEAAKVKRTPIIVYAKEDMKQDIKKELTDYYLHSLCQTPLRLTNDVFGILSTFKHE